MAGFPEASRTIEARTESPPTLLMPPPLAEDPRGVQEGPAWKSPPPIRRSETPIRYRISGLQLFGIHVLDVRGEAPAVPFRVGELARAVAVELVLGFDHDRRARGTGGRDRGIDVRHVHVER